MKLKTSQKTLDSVFLIAVISLLMAPYLRLDFYNGDSHILIITKNLADAFSGYWKHIFLNPNGFWIQYRPLGFFGYFYAGNAIFGENPQLFRIFGMALYFLIGLKLYQILKIESSQRLPFYILIPVFFFHYTISYPIIDFSCIGKYLFPTLFLVTGLHHVSLRSGDPSKINVLFLFALSFVSLLFHEGSLVFPLIFILFIAIKRNLIPLDFILLVPTLTYFLFRTLFLGWPKDENFMAVGFGQVPFQWAKLIGLIFLPQLWHESQWSLFFILTIFLMGAFSVYLGLSLDKKKRPFFLVCFVSIALLILPFAALKNHFEFDLIVKSGIWAMPFWILLIALPMGEKSKKIPTKHILIGAFLILNLYGSYMGKQEIMKSYANLQLNTSDFQKFILDHGSQFSRDDFNLIEVDKQIAQSEMFDQYLILDVFPSILALKFQDMSFLFRDLDGLKSVAFDGRSYNVMKEEQGELLLKDVYGFEMRMKKPQIGSSIKLLGPRFR